MPFDITVPSMLTRQLHLIWNLGQMIWSRTASLFRADSKSHARRLTLLVDIVLWVQA